MLLAAIGLALASLSGRRAYATGIVAIFFFLTWTRGHAADPGRGRARRVRPSTGARMAGLFSPFTVLDGVRIWLGGTSPGD